MINIEIIYLMFKTVLSNCMIDTSNMLKNNANGKLDQIFLP